MGFIQKGKDKLVDIALNTYIRGKIVNPNLEGIGVVKEIRYKDKIFTLTVELAGLEDKPITLYATDIDIADDGSSVAVRKFASNMPFMQAALSRFLAGTPIAIPADNRDHLITAKKLLGL